MAGRDNHKDLFHPLSNAGGKNTSDKVKILVQIKLENPF